MRPVHVSCVAFVVSFTFVACSSDTTTGGDGGEAQGGEAQGGAAAGGATTSSQTGGQGGGTSAGGAPVEGGGGSATGGGPTSIDDPNLDGPYDVEEIQATLTATGGGSLPVRAGVPTAGPGGGPFPVVLVAHGFQLPASQYASYVTRLASHGFVAINVDYPAGFIGVNNVENANDLLAALDWAATAPELAGIADASLAGATGHSLGGKLSLLAATLDPRIRATITLDPVDASMNCSPSDCPDVSALMPLDIPTAFLGETLDASGGFQPCAPAQHNYTTFYAGTTSPSLQVTVLGANHMSFIDDVASCGFTCGFCNTPTLDNATVNALSKAFVVAFYRRWLNGEQAYDDYLTGPAAQARYVETGLATIASK